MDLSTIESLYMKAIQQIQDCRSRQASAPVTNAPAAAVSTGSKFGIQSSGSIAAGNASISPQENQTSRSEKIALHQLYFIFGGQMRRAFSLLDARAIGRLSCEPLGGNNTSSNSQKSLDVTIYRVKDTDRTYNVLMNASCGAKFCNCDSFTNNLISDSSVILCNHVLAVLLAEAYAEVDVIAIDLLRFIEISSTLC